jgi:hypothetical protein
MGSSIPSFSETDIPVIADKLCREVCPPCSTMRRQPIPFLGRFEMHILKIITVMGFVIAVMTTSFSGRFGCVAQTGPTVQPSAPQARLPVQTTASSSGQLTFRNVGEGAGTIQLNGGDIIMCGPNQACGQAFIVTTGETLGLSATAQCNTSYFVQFSLPCSSGGNTTRPGRGYCSFVNRASNSQYPLQMTVFFDRVPPNAKPPIPCG